MTRAFHASDRVVLRITGGDAETFLQDLVTNDIRRLADGPVYAALLTPQGKYLADFFLLRAPGGGVFMDADAAQAPGLVQRLTMYKLRAAVTIEETGLQVLQGLGDPPSGGWMDPRDPELGWRALVPEATAALTAMSRLDRAEWDALRIRLGVPAAGAELIPNDSYILEMGFDRLHGVDFRKGCYVGQEVTARMRHKTELRKGLVRVAVEGDALAGSTIDADGKPAGTLHSVAGGQGLAYLRFDRIGEGMTAGGARLRVLDMP